MIEIKSVRKRYGSFLAVDDVTFDVKPGEIVAFVGPNGAGKSTVLKMISTYLKPDGGSIKVGGRDVVREADAVRAGIGYMPEKSICYEGMRVDGFLKFVGEAHGMKGAALRGQFDWIVESCSLESVLHKRVGECSKGFQRRVALAMSLIHDPDVLLMDEPTHGLDPLQVLLFRDFIVSLKPGKAILFSSHVFQEVVAMCDRLVVINNARLLADGSIDSIASRAGMPRVVSCAVDAPAGALRDALDAVASGNVVEISETGPDASRLEIEAVESGLKADLEKAITDGGWSIKSYVEQPLDLERVFARIVQKSNEEDNN